MGTNLTIAEQHGLALIKASLYDWKLAQAKRIAPSEAAAAFELVVSWLDATARVWAGGVTNVEQRMTGFVRAYFPVDYHRHTRALYDGLRNALLHEYGTRRVALTEKNPDEHLETIGGSLVLDIARFLDDCDGAFQKFYAELQANPHLRARALSASQGLLQPVQLVPTQEERRSNPVLSSVAASATSSTVIPVRRAR